MSFLLQNHGMCLHLNRSGLLLLLAALLNVMGAAPALAALGGDPASVQRDVAEMHGLLQSTSVQHYDVAEITCGNGIRVREFVARGGTVFAIVWSGPARPDLRQLLGANFESYEAALHALKRPGLQRSLRIALSTLVVESGGHLRAYAGRAYLPALLPLGASIAELR